MSRLQSALDRWRGTPYLDGHASPGIGVDCIRFVDEVLQEMLALKLRPLPVLPPQASMHSGRAVARMALRMRDRFPHTVLRPPCELLPGDVLLTRFRGRRWPGHVWIIGPDGRPWHSIEGARVGPSHCCPNHWDVVRVWRPRC